MSSAKSLRFCLGLIMLRNDNTSNKTKQNRTITTTTFPSNVYIWRKCCSSYDKSLRWRHNDHAGVSNHQPHGCLLNRLFRRKSKKTSKLRVTGLCAGNSPGTGEFPAQMASYAENVSIWWRHHVASYRMPKSALLYSTFDSWWKIWFYDDMVFYDVSDEKKPCN